MKITKSKLRQIIQEELSSLSEQGLSSDPRTEGDPAAENTAIVLNVIMLGLEPYLSKIDDEEQGKKARTEYYDAAKDILDQNAPMTKSISDLILDIEREVAKQGTYSGAAPGSALLMFDEEVQATIERLGYAPDKIGAPSSQDVAGIALDKIDHVFIDRVKTEISDDDVRTRAEGIAQDLGFIRKSHEDQKG
jgi:hypothetical protein